MLRLRTAVGTVSLLVAALSAFPAFAQHPILSKHVPTLVSSRSATRVAAVPRAQPVELVLSLPFRNQAQLDGLLADLYNPASPNYRHWLTPEQFDSSFAPTEDDYRAVMDWVEASGLTIKATAANRHILTIAGSARAVNAAFNIELTAYHDNIRNRDFQAPDREPTVSLSVPLLAVSGLDTSNPRVNHLKKAPADLRAGTARASAEPRIIGSGPSGTTYLPSDMRAAYYTSALPNGSTPLTGAGQNVAVFSYDGYLQSSFTAWRNKTGVAAPATVVTNVFTGGFDGGCELYNPCDDGEQVLDVLQVEGMAPGLSNIYFYEGLSAVIEINQFISDKKAPIMTSSWGGGDFGPGTAPLFQQMAAQGMTFLNASGDDGAYNGFSYLPPSNDPYVLQVGATDLVTTGAAGPWASEPGWVDSGGGFFNPNLTIPTWQQTAGVITSTNKGSTTLRNDPDMALEGNFDNSTAANGTYQSGYGGTSYAAPRLAGYLALANQQSVANGYGTIGYINPTLYDLGLRSDAASIFHDPSSGSNPANSGGPSVSYTAVAGYDLVTGWGSPNGAGLINALAGPNFSLSMASSATIVRSGSTSIGITLTQLNGFVATPTLAVSGLPSGVTSSITQNSSTSYTLTLTGDATVVYGNSTLTLTATSGVITHSATLSLVAIKRSTGDFTLSAANTTVVQQASANSVVTVTPGAGLAAPVGLSLGTLPAGVTASFDTTTTSSTANITFSASIASAPGTYPISVIGTGGGTAFTHTAIVYLTISPVPSALSNGGFEASTLSPWTYTSTEPAGDYYGFCNASCGYYPHGGSNFILMNNIGATGTDTMSQSFTVSGGTTKATLNFWLWISSAETTTTTKHDTLTVALYNSSGTLLSTVATFSNLNKGSGYVLYSYDLSAYLGQTVTLKFTGVENSSRATGFLLDDISVVVQ